MSDEKQERNDLIYARKHRDGKSYKDISKEFNISETRVRQILQQVSRKRKRNSYSGHSFYIYPIEESCKEFNASDTTRGRIYHALWVRGYLKRNRWLRLSEDEIRSIPLLGKFCTQILLRAQEIALNS